MANGALEQEAGEEAGEQEAGERGETARGRLYQRALDQNTMETNITRIKASYVESCADPLPKNKMSNMVSGFHTASY